MFRFILLVSVLVIYVESQTENMTENDLSYAKHLMIKIQTEYTECSIKDFLLILKELGLNKACDILESFDFKQNNLSVTPSPPMSKTVPAIEEVTITAYHQRINLILGQLRVIQRYTYRVLIFEIATTLNQDIEYRLKGEGKAVPSRSNEYNGGWNLNWSIVTYIKTPKPTLVAIAMADKYYDQFHKQLKEKSIYPSSYILNESLESLLSNNESLLSNNECVLSDIFIN